uniref:RNA-directed RNA polymerase n=1 Tax=Leviviridae sp. TaxID=2027243 RepID=A0A514CYL2_9VIRU|nr:MAG: RNA-dependent RNA polymerase [Leviviridae sp.]
MKVIDVPKTMKTPRIIAMEPTAMQYAQQGILRLIQDAIKGSYLNDFIGLDDQEPNQLMARQGSAVGDLATLDLSEASIEFHASPSRSC